MTELTFRIRAQAQAKPIWRRAFMAAGVFTDAYEIVVRPLKAKRSADQNRRLWALYREVAATVWVDGRQYADEVWHEHFKRELIGREEITLPSGEVEVRGISTTTLTVGDMGRYMDAIALWCAERGFPVMEAAA